MNPIVRNILAVLAGLVVGSVVNMGLIMAGSAIIPPPEGVDVTTPEGLEAAIPLLESRHFVFPFLAHALGTLAGAFLAARLAGSRGCALGMLIGGFFMAGGAYYAFTLPAPLWFEALDLVVAYLPMAFVGGRLATRNA